MTKRGLEDVNHLECCYYYSSFRVLTRQYRQEVHFRLEVTGDACQAVTGCWMKRSGRRLECGHLRLTAADRGSVHLLPAVLGPVEADLLASFIVPAGERCHLLVDELHDLFLRDAVRTDVVDRPPPVMPHPVVPNVSTSLPADRARPDVLLQEDEESVSGARPLHVLQHAGDHGHAGRRAVVIRAVLQLQGQTQVVIPLHGRRAALDAVDVKREGCMLVNAKVCRRTCCLILIVSGYH